MKHWIGAIAVLLAAATAATAAGRAERSIEWLRGKSRHVPARPGDSVVVECKVLGKEQGRCELEIVLKELITGEAAWTILEQVKEHHPRPKEGRQYVLARFRIKVFEKEGEKLFHVDETLFSAANANGIIYTGRFPLEKLKPSIVADLREGAEYDGWVCFLVKSDDASVAVFGRKWGAEAYFVLSREAGEAGADLIPYKGQLRTATWVETKHRAHRREFAFADDLFIEISSIPFSLSEMDFSRPRGPGDPAPRVGEAKAQFGRIKTTPAGERSTGLIRNPDEISNFEAIEDWGWVDGKVFQILGREDLLVEGREKTFHIREYSTTGIVDGSAFRQWIEIVGTYGYKTVSGTTRTVWDCRVKDVDFCYPVKLEQFRRLLRLGVELYRWEGEGERCPECKGRGAVFVKETITQIIGNITRRRTVTEVVTRAVKCKQCNGTGFVGQTWKKMKDY